MIKIRENYVMNKQGKPMGVLINIKEYRRLMKEVEELAAIRAYDEAKASKDEIIPFSQVIDEIERKRS